MTYPKIWGDRQNVEARIVGEARERALQSVDAPYLTAIGPGFSAEKRGAFSEVNLTGESAGGKIELTAGFTFKRANDSTTWGPPEVAGSPLGTEGGPLSWSKFTTKAKDLALARKYKFIRRADDAYGAASWFGNTPTRVSLVGPSAQVASKPEGSVLSWDAATVCYTGIIYSWPGLMAAYRKEGYSGLCGMGMGTRLYWKNQVALDLMDPEIVAPLSAGVVAEYTIAGAGMTKKHIYFAAAKNVLGQTGAKPNDATPPSGRYRVNFFRVRYRIVTSGDVATIKVGKELELVATFSSLWLTENIAGMCAASVLKYGAPGVYSSGYHNEPWWFREYALIPLQDWRFDEACTQATCVFVESMYPGDTLHMNPVVTLNVSDGTFSYDPRLRLDSTDTSGVRAPGTAEAHASDFRDKVTLFGGHSTFAYPYEGGFEQERHSNLLRVSNPAFGFVIQAGYSGSTAVRAELSVTDYRRSYQVRFSVRRAGYPDPFTISGERTVDRYAKTELIFYAGELRQSSFLWTEEVETGSQIRAAGTTDFIGFRNFKRTPAQVLYLDAASQTAVWVEVSVEPNWRSTYSTIDVAVQHPTFPPEYLDYKLYPESVTVIASLRMVTNGTEQPPVEIRRAVYPVLTLPVEGAGVLFAPTPAYEYAGEQNTFVELQGWNFYTDYGQFRNEYMYNTPEIQAASADGSGARFYDAVMWSLRSSLLPLADVMEKAAKWDAFNPNDLGTPVVTENHVFKSYLTAADPETQAEIAGVEKPWFQRISIF